MYIPIAITLLVAYLTRFFDKLLLFINQYSTAVAQNVSANTTTASLIQPELIAGLYSSGMIISIVVFVLFVIFALFATIAIAILAETDKFSSAFQIGDIMEDIGNIGWGNYIV
ncbi:hypothetical protein ALNOE001_21380 [Candidatus Methanobinarius endosymbioticus]|uniref:Uncharacterized protein n=1 Tax=Candidatus Methanobinarius endosymbioticus TaxID=2006182 RepID=A0A366M823_9EURY|nr:hypothetical protein ALNOE001_21380 [Candidatus Methanobinarius endosymbioticus]